MTPEQDCSQTNSQRLPDTCPISQTDLSHLTWGSQNSEKAWGRLYATKPELQSLELTRDEYTVGRGSSCDLAITVNGNNRENEVSRILGAVSKVHFRIRRTNISSPDYDDFIVHLDDLSSNGTYVNGRKVGKGNSVILEHNNEISVCFSYYKVLTMTAADKVVETSTTFIYISSGLDSEVRAYPEAVKTKYSVSRVLGSGSFGQVRLVFEKCSGRPLAMKVIQKKRLCNNVHQLYDPVRTQREVDVLKALSNAFIIKFENVIDSENHMFIVTEYVEGGELFYRVKNGPLMESDAKLYFYQLARAVKYLHENDIIHRDIKLENILLSSRGPESLIKLSDFGFSKFLDQESMMMTYCGTPMYIAPEILKNKGRAGSYDRKVDIWSMGVVLFICLSGVPPFESSGGKQLAERILKGDYSFGNRNWGRVSRKAICLVSRMLTVNPEERISTEDVLTHIWLQDRSISMRVNRLLKKAATEQPLFSDDEVDSDVENSKILKKARAGN